MLPSSTLYLTQSPYGPTMRRISCTANGKVRHSLFILGLGKECYSCYVLHLLSRLLPHTQAKQHASLTSHSRPTESAPHHARASGGVSLCVVNSLSALEKSAVQTTKRPSAVKHATNWPLGAIAIAQTRPVPAANSWLASASMLQTPSPAARSTWGKVQHHIM